MSRSTILRTTIFLRTTGLLFIGVALFGCGEQQQQSFEDQSIRPARIMQIEGQYQDIEHQFVGRIEALKTVDLSFKVGGPLAQLPILEGQTVETGILLAALDPTDYDLALQEAGVQLQLAQNDLQRKQQILKDRGIAKSAVDDAQSLFELQNIRLAKARQSLKDSQITAPFDAYIAKRFVENHGLVSPGQPIVRLHDLSQLLVIASLPEQLVATVSADQVQEMHAEFSFAPGQSFPLVYHENRGEADPVAQTYAVSFLMEKPEEWNILPGMNVTLATRIKNPQSIEVLIPVSALVSQADSQLAVWVYDPQTQVVSRKAIIAGATTKGGVSVKSGLKPGDHIVTAGASQLQQGMKIRPLSP